MIFKNRKIWRLISAALVVLWFAGIFLVNGQIMPNPQVSPTVKITPTPKKESPDDDVIKVDSKLVVVPVSVSDSRGEVVKNLRAEDFLLRENGRQQEIESLSDPEQIPLDIALLIDVSGSVNQRFTFQKEAAERFLRQIFQPKDSVSIFTIDQKPVLIQPLSDLEKAVEKLRTIEPARSTTAFFDTVAEAALYLMKTTKPGHRRVIVVISDGEDTFSEKYLSVGTTSAELQRADALFYSINPGGASIRLNRMSQHGQDVMQALATATGGAAFVPETNSELETAFRQITAELRSQYLLQYYSNAENMKGGFVPLQVKIPSRPDLRIRFRQGYYLQP